MIPAASGRTGLGDLFNAAVGRHAREVRHSFRSKERDHRRNGIGGIPRGVRKRKAHKRGSIRIRKGRSCSMPVLKPMTARALPPGRVLNVTAAGRDLAAARDLAYEAVGRLSFEGAFLPQGHRPPGA